MDMRERVKERLQAKIINWQEHSYRRVYFTVNKEDIFETVRFLFKELGMRFATATCTDMPEGFEIIYHFSFDKSGEFYSVRVILSGKDKPQIDSVTPIFPGAEWIEREIWEMFGVDFTGHPNLKRLLLADEWPEGKFPMRREA